MRHLLVILITVALGCLVTATAQSEQRLVHVSVTHQGSEASLINIRLEPDMGHQEIFVSISKRNAGRGANIHRWRRLQAVAPGLYRMTYDFPEAGQWSFYVHYGTGLSGFEASARTLITRSPGQVETLSMPFRYYPVGADALPPYVQSAGYAGFFLLVAILLFAVARILLLLRRQLQVEGGHVSA